MKQETEKTPEVRIQELEKQVTRLSWLEILQTITIGFLVLNNLLNYF